MRSKRAGPGPGGSTLLVEDPVLQPKIRSIQGRVHGRKREAVLGGAGITRRGQA